MKRAFLRALLARRAAIKQRWRAALQSAPTHTPLANPDLLAYMMDETLDELLVTVWHPKAVPHCNDANTTCVLAKTCNGCGLNPYIGYFLAGEAALVGAIRSIQPSHDLSENQILNAEIELLFAFRVLSHREVNSFCEICRVEHPSAAHGDQPTLPRECPFKTGAAASSPALAWFP